MSARLAIALTALAMAAAAQAQDWPQRPIRIVVPFAAGASPDILARIVNDRLAARLGQPLIVDNRPGAGGNTGTDQAAKAPPDGYTFLLSVNAPLVHNTILPNAARIRPARHPGRAPVCLHGAQGHAG
ncbi:Bug family tripartite tricarboxylate transporter substrate binding protein [Xylophilus sp. ASV27]|uniref:Bug family tripartite tricarboxylate transporter substrate binding protein n=1 Tax=Xylophilus sp. ASV27 TaxID=2795129 RepID=UPI001E2971CD|nr:tripartite tricarboxylate transporter substrate-binding protein [Xylophilus sp. ASV27]